MNKVSTRFSTVARIVPNAAAAGAGELAARLTAVYERSQKSNYVFASPLGPFHHGGRARHLPRFVYFGPHTHDESLRLAVLSGFDARDLRAAAAVLVFVERLAGQPELAQGLNLSFFPLVDALGSEGEAVGRHLATSHWGDRANPEVVLLAKDARSRGYHGFVRIESDSAESVVSLRLRTLPASDASDRQVELVDPAHFDAWAVRWEHDRRPQSRVEDGPLSIADDLPLRPYELTLRLPQAWSAEVIDAAVPQLLRQFILRQGSLQAYRQNL